MKQKEEQRSIVVDLMHVYQGRECVGEREGWIAYWNFYKWTRLCKLLRQATKITRLYEYGCVYYFID